MTALTDEELVAKYRQAGGRPNGTPFVDELFQRHYSRVAFWCFRIAGDREKATDLAQEVFSKAWVHLDHFREDSKFTTWIYMIARNHCFNSVKSQSRRLEDAVDGQDLDILAHTSEDFASDIDRAQLLNTAREMMAKELTPTEVRVMTLHYAEEMPLPVISRLLKMDNPSGAKAYIVSAKRKLKAAVDLWSRKSRQGRG